MFFEMNEYDDFLESADEVGGDSRDVSLERTECQMAKMVVALESAEEMYDLNLREAELKVYAESGTDEDFMTYCEAAKTDLDQKTDNIVKKLWGKVVQFFQMLKEKFFGGKGKNMEKDDRIQCPKPLAFVIKKINPMWSSVKSALASGKNKLSENGNWKKLCAALGAVTAVSGGVFLYTKKYRDFGKQVAENMKAKAGAGTPDQGKMVDLKAYEEITGVEFNKAYITFEEIDSFCLKHSKKMYDGMNKTMDAMGADTAKEMSALGSLIKPIVSKMNGLRLKKEKAAVATA